MKAGAEVSNRLEKCQIACLERAAGTHMLLTLHIHLYAPSCSQDTHRLKFAEFLHQPGSVHYPLALNSPHRADSSRPMRTANCASFQICPSPPSTLISTPVM